jgi:CDGSH-type Zn-finger protein
MEKTKITVMKNGSLKVEGDFIVLDQEGNEYGIGGRTILSFCRCGHSSNMPFCDGTHKHKGFEHEPKAFDLPPKKTT